MENSTVYTLVGLLSLLLVFSQHVATSTQAANDINLFWKLNDLQMLADRFESLGRILKLKRNGENPLYLKSILKSLGENELDISAVFEHLRSSRRTSDDHSDVMITSLGRLFFSETIFDWSVSQLIRQTEEENSRQHGSDTADSKYWPTSQLADSIRATLFVDSAIDFVVDAVDNLTDGQIRGTNDLWGDICEPGFLLIRFTEAMVSRLEASEPLLKEALKSLVRSEALWTFLQSRCSRGIQPTVDDEGVTTSVDAQEKGSDTDVEEALPTESEKLDAQEKGSDTDVEEVLPTESEKLEKKEFLETEKEGDTVQSEKMLEEDLPEEVATREEPKTIARAEEVKRLLREEFFVSANIPKTVNQTMVQVTSEVGIQELIDRAKAHGFAKWEMKKLTIEQDGMKTIAAQYFTEEQPLSYEKYMSYLQSIAVTNFMVKAAEDPKPVNFEQLGAAMQKTNFKEFYPMLTLLAFPAFPEFTQEVIELVKYEKSITTIRNYGTLPLVIRSCFEKTLQLVEAGDFDSAIDTIGFAHSSVLGRSPWNLEIETCSLSSNN